MAQQPRDALVVATDAAKLAAVAVHPGLVASIENVASRAARVTNVVAVVSTVPEAC